MGQQDVSHWPANRLSHITVPIEELGELGTGLLIRTGKAKDRLLGGLGESQVLAEALDIATVPGVEDEPAARVPHHRGPNRRVRQAGVLLGHNDDLNAELAELLK